jgi:hydrogenase nickel incorporation protein HypB
MCATCGCAQSDGVRLTSMAGTRPNLQSHSHPHEHEHDHSRLDHSGHEHPGTETISLEQRVLAKNDALAERNRSWLGARAVRAVNVMSSPGAGKTTLLVRTILDIGHRIAIYVVEGDQETTFDADRVKATGAPVLQINTGSGCHLDASMLAGALHSLDPGAGALVIVENVGNLVCPALFDLGEDRRVVLMSVTEGADKPLKYPHIFRTATVVVLNKIDLLPYVDFDVDRFHRDLALVNPTAMTLPLSATTGTGLSAWYDWLSSG